MKEDEEVRTVEEKNTISPGGSFRDLLFKPPKCLQRSLSVVESLGPQ
jgi:hypothetical protein